MPGRRVVTRAIPPVDDLQIWAEQASEENP